MNGFPADKVLFAACIKCVRALVPVFVCVYAIQMCVAVMEWREKRVKRTERDGETETEQKKDRENKTGIQTKTQQSIHRCVHSIVTYQTCPNDIDSMSGSRKYMGYIHAMCAWMCECWSHRIHTLGFYMVRSWILYFFRFNMAKAVFDVGCVWFIALRFSCN